AGAGVEHLDAAAAVHGPDAHGQDVGRRLPGHRLMGVLDQVQQHLLDLVLVGVDGWARRELRPDLDVVLAELVRLELEHAAHPIWWPVASSSATSSSLKRSLVWRPSESVPSTRPRLRMGTHTKPRMSSVFTARLAGGNRWGSSAAESSRTVSPVAATLPMRP